MHPTLFAVFAVAGGDIYEGQVFNQKTSIQGGIISTYTISRK
jgi:hypothetical protein